MTICVVAKEGGNGLGLSFWVSGFGFRIDVHFNNYKPVRMQISTAAATRSILLPIVADPRGFILCSGRLRLNRMLLHSSSLSTEAKVGLVSRLVQSH